MTDRTVAALLSELTAGSLVAGDASTRITGVTHDSRQVSTGSLFVAVPGFRVDGHAFIPEVVTAGAGAVLVQQDRQGQWQIPRGVTAIAVPDTRVALAEAAAWFFGHPGRELTVIGLTGTDGKTTTSYLLTSVLESSGAKVGRLGTVDAYITGEAGGISTTRMTTPEAPEVQRMLRKMADAGCTYAIVESTSHGLALHRLDHVEYDVAAFTNITGDHLDFHQTFEAYRAAKGLLFEALASSVAKEQRKVAVVDEDDPNANFMAGRAGSAAVVRYGMEAREADLLARNVALRADRSQFQLVHGTETADVNLQIPALFNVSNALCAAAVGLSVGMTLPAVAAGLNACTGVPGRMERIAGSQPFGVIVDYAHTGDAVRKVLEVLRGVCTGKLIVVVGAAGERDPGRRFGVARATADSADFAIFTSEDPRSEDPASIVREIGRHAEGAGRARGTDFLEIDDRREAIAEVLRRATADDVVVVLGKGHEQSMVYGDQVIPWDDRQVTREELAKLGFSLG